MPQPITLDTRGLSCPQPALQTSEALRRLGGGSLAVLVDPGTAQDNVARLARRAGWSVTEELQADGSLRLTLQK
jgi:TusA-related sulfurtransferase